MTDRALHAKLIWAGGTHRFALPFLAGGLSRHTVRDPHPRLRRILVGEWTTTDVVETIEQALLHGRNGFAIGSAEVSDLVRKFVLARPMAENAVLAQAILLVVLFGVPGDMAETPLDAAAVAAKASAEKAEA